MNVRLSLCAIALPLVLVACTQSQDASLEPSSEHPLLPNIEALPADDLSLETTDGGRTLLRFDATTWNSGAGPLELVGGNEIDEDGQEVYQRVYHDDGSTEDHLVGTFVHHEDHDHIHVEDYADYTLTPAASDGSDDEATASGDKTSFCIMDTDRIDHKLDGAPKRAVYTECEVQVQGMSVGWGDTYTSDLPGQYIDVTDGVPEGDYRLTIRANPNEDDALLEESYDDNLSEVYVHLDVEAGTVEVIDDPNEDDSDDDSDDGGSPGNGGGNCPHC